MTTINIDFTGVETLSMGTGFAPPEGAYKAAISECNVEPSKSGSGMNLVVSYNVVEGQYTGGGCKAWFPMPTGDNAKKDSFKKSKLKRLFCAIGLPANALEGSVQIATTDLVGKNLVIFIEDDEQRTASNGRRAYDAHVVLPEDGESALSGQWTPRGGRVSATTTVATDTAPAFNAQAPSNGGGTTAAAPQSLAGLFPNA